MSHIEDLQTSREKLVDLRRKIAANIVAGSVADLRRATGSIEGIQTEIEAIDRAIADEGRLVPPKLAYGSV